MTGFGLLASEGRALPLKPNWRQPVVAEYEFLTHIETSRDGTEQRQALRQTPRAALEFTSSITSLGVDAFMARLQEANGHHTPFFNPVRWRKVATTAEASAAQALVEVVEIPFWMADGVRLVLTDGTKQEAVVIASISGTTVTLEDNLVGTFSSGANVFHALYTRLPDRVRATALVEGLYEMAIRHEADPGDDPMLFPAEVPDTYEDQEVFLRRANWRDTPQVDMEQLREAVDPGFGKMAVEAPEGFTRSIIQAMYSAKTVSDAESLLAFVMRVKGRRGQFWKPDHTRSVSGVQSVSSGSSSLTIDGTDFYDAYHESRVFKAVYVEWPNGSWQINRMDSIGLSGNDSVATMADNWTADIDATTKVRMCPTCRLASDTVEFTWDTAAHAEAQLSFQTLPE